MKAEKYNILIEVAGGGGTLVKVRHGFGAAGEEVQKLLEQPGVERIRVGIDGTTTEVSFIPTGKPFRLLDIKQKIKSLSFDF